MNDPFTMMRSLDWSHAERVIARKAFDLALRRELDEVILEAKTRAARIEPLLDWRLGHPAGPEASPRTACRSPERFVDAEDSSSAALEVVVGDLLAGRMLLTCQASQGRHRTQLAQPDREGVVARSVFTTILDRA